MSIIYRLKNGKKKGFWQLPIVNQTALKEVKTVVNGQESTELREKPIVYVRGSNSIFIEDQEKDHKPTKVWFEDGELVVQEGNWTLNQLLQNHKMFNVEYELVDEEKYAAKKVSNIKEKNKVQTYILEEPDNYVIKAMAMAILGAQEAVKWGDSQCREKLLEYSENHTQTLIDEMAKPGYEHRLLAATAYNSKIVKDNATHTAVVWADSHGVIVHVAQGENGIDKLGAFFSEGTEAARIVMQEIGNRSNKNSTALKQVKEGLSKPAKTEAEIRAEVEAEAEQKYEALKKELLANANTTPVVTNDTTPTSTSTDTAPDETLTYDAKDIEAAREVFAKVTGKSVPPNMNQNLDWINKRIQEATSQTA